MKRGYAYVSYVISLGFVVTGFYKLWAYKNSDSTYGDHVNVYVGGDAYNYIINGTHATSYFIVALMFLILGCFILLIEKLDELKEIKNNRVSDNTSNLNENEPHTIEKSTSFQKNTNTREKSFIAVSIDDYKTAGGLKDINLYKRAFMVYGTNDVNDALNYLKDVFPAREFEYDEKLNAFLEKK